VGRAGNMSTGSPFIDKSRLGFSKDPLLKELRNYSTGAEASYE